MLNPRTGNPLTPRRSYCGCSSTRQLQLQLHHIVLPLLLCRYFDMVAANQQAAELALELYSDCVRWLLLVGGGYECQVRLE